MRNYSLFPLDWGTLTISLPAAAALCISLVALFVAIKNYRRKAGLCVRGSFSVAASRACNDQYVKTIILENLKDRAITIFAAYLQVGYNLYILIEDFDDKPLILKAFESYQKEYGPIEFYSSNSDRIDLNNLFDNKKIKKRLVLSTADGKYVIPSSIQRWNPISDFFKNHMTIMVYPLQSIYKEKYLGANIKYVVDIEKQSGKTEVVPIQANDFQIKVFRTFSLTQESLKNKEALSKYISEQILNGNLICRRFLVHDIETWRENANKHYSGQPIIAESCNAFQYFILGRVFTLYSDWKLNRENQKRSKEVQL